jgi:hypothetical protein
MWSGLIWLLVKMFIVYILLCAICSVLKSDRQHNNFCNKQINTIVLELCFLVCGVATCLELFWAIIRWSYKNTALVTESFY